VKKIGELILGSVKLFNARRCSLHAAGLTYFTMLSFVPVLCLMLLLAKTCGIGDVARNQINTRLDAYITQIETAPDDPAVAVHISQERRAAKKEAAKDLANQARTIINQLFDRADKFDASTLGWIGLAMLAWTVISTFGMVETSMNEVWGVPKSRPIWKRCLLYLFVSLVLPVLATLALSMPVMAMVRKVLEGAAGYIPYSKGFMDFLVAVLFSRTVSIVVTFAFASMAFGFFYQFMPYCKVRVRWALIAGAATAIGFWLWLRICVCAQVGVANSSVLYGSFAFVPIILAWVYVSWQILLFGSVLTCQLQSVYSSSRD
jgi:membrane protein